MERLEKKKYLCGSCKETIMANLKPGETLVCPECGGEIYSTDEVKP